MWLFSARYRYGTTSSSTCGLHACRGKATGNRRQKIWPPVDEDFAKIPIQIPFTKDSCWLERKMDQDVKKSMCDIGEIWFLCRSVSLQSSIKDARTKGGRVRQNAVKSRQGGDRVSTYVDVHNVLSADFKKLADCIDELCLQSDAGWLQLVLVDVATELSDYSNIVVRIACGSLTVGPTVYAEVSGDPYVTPQSLPYLPTRVFMSVTLMLRRITYQVSQTGATSCLPTAVHSSAHLYRLQSVVRW